METQITGKLCVDMFKRLGIVPDTDEYLHPSNLIGLSIPRDSLTKDGQLEQINDILHELRGFYSASGMSCLRSNNASQKAPVINALRQIVKANGLFMKPCSRSDGYEASGKKKVYRWFEIHSLDESLEDIRCQVTKPENLEENQNRLLTN